jgi:hypothetical protein
MADAKDFGNDVSYDEKNGINASPPSPENYKEAAERRGSVALNIVENPLTVSSMT